jgi:vacuolar-type H+-ATPase subunit H
MESITAHLAKIEDLILRIEDLLEGARPTAFSTKVSVDKNKVYELIDELKPYLDDIMQDLPDEIVKAKRVVADSEKILGDAKSKALMILRSNEAEAEKLISEHEITKLAAAQAEQIIEDARKFAKELRLNAVEYADEILVKTEETVRDAQNAFAKSWRDIEKTFTDTVDLIFENRQELRGSDRQPPKS